MFLLIDIENLTHKTGNFKQFSIFSNMLKTALLKVSSNIFFYFYILLLTFLWWCLLPGQLWLNRSKIGSIPVMVIISFLIFFSFYVVIEYLDLYYLLCIFMFRLDYRLKEIWLLFLVGKVSFLACLWCCCFYWCCCCYLTLWDYRDLFSVFPTATILLFLRCSVSRTKLFNVLFFIETSKVW